MNTVFIDCRSQWDQSVSILICTLRSDFEVGWKVFLQTLISRRKIRGYKATFLLPSKSFLRVQIKRLSDFNISFQHTYAKSGNFEVSYSSGLFSIYTWTLADSLIFTVHIVLWNCQFSKRWLILLKNGQFWESARGIGNFKIDTFSRPRSMSLFSITKFYNFIKQGYCKIFHKGFCPISFNLCICSDWLLTYSSPFLFDT